MDKKLREKKLGVNVPIGSKHYRAYIGPPEKYDLVGAMQFNLLTSLGLREDHFLLDIGCGSLRAGKLFLTYLLPRRYYGIEPAEWLIEEGIKNELGKEIIELKKPIFSYDNNFTLSFSNQKFDFLLAQSIFSHASERQIIKCLSEARKVMKPISVFAATFVQGEENYEGSEWVYPDCVTYTFNHFSRLVEGEGLVCKPLNWPHPNNQKWVGIFNKGYEENIPNYKDISKLIKEEKKTFIKGKFKKFLSS